jgi:hypothetical protein
VLEEAVTLHDRLHGGLLRETLEVNLAAVLRDLGEFAVADESLRQVGDELRGTLTNSPDEPATDLAIAENHHAQLWLMLGQPKSALAYLRADDATITQAWVDGAQASLKALPPYDLDADAAWCIVHRAGAR